MATKLGQYRKAFRAVGDGRLNTLEEDNLSRRVLDDIWDDSIQYMLRQGGWKFALSVVELEPDDDVTVDFGPAYAFSIPGDFVRLAGIAMDEQFRTELPDYDEHDGHWWTDRSPLIYVRYVSNATDKGLNLGAWPVDFAEAHAVYMARQGGLTITKSGVTKQTLDADFDRALNRSKTLDAIGDAVKRKPQGSWVRSRTSSGIRPGWER